LPSRNQRRTKCRGRESSVDRTAVDRRPTFGLPLLAHLSRGTLIGLCLLISGCRQAAQDKTRPRGPAFERGDRVVVEPLGGEFFEGRVLSVMPERLRIERGRTGEALTVAANDVYRLPAALAANEAGRLAICSVEATWIGCRIESSGGPEVTVRTLDDRTLALSRSAVLAPSSVTELNLRQRFERRAARAQFVEAAARAGEPLAPPGYRPQPQARVIAERQGGWWSAVVLGMSDDEDEDEREVTVRFSSDGLEQTVPARSVVPEPVQSPAPARGAFVLIRPISPAEAWKRVRVLSAIEDEAKVIDQDGSERTVAFRDVLALGAD
jgi:hypothetical protein